MPRFAKKRLQDLTFRCKECGPDSEELPYEQYIKHVKECIRVKTCPSCSKILGVMVPIDIGK